MSRITHVYVTICIYIKVNVSSYRSVLTTLNDLASSPLLMCNLPLQQKNPSPTFIVQFQYVRTYIHSTFRVVDPYPCGKQPEDGAHVQFIMPLQSTRLHSFLELLSQLFLPPSQPSVRLCVCTI